MPTKIQPRRIDGKLTFNADNVYMSALVADYNLGLNHESTQGLIQLGTLTPAGDQNYEIGVESEEVSTGVPETAKDDLITKLTGQAELMITDMNPHAAKFAMGTQAEIQWTTAGLAATYSNTVTGTTSTNQTLYVSTASTVVAGDIVKVQLGGTGANAYYYPGIVARKDTSANTITLKYPLPEKPVEGNTVDLVGGYTIYHGGNTLLNITAIIQCDFPKGDQHLLQIFKGSATGGFKRQMGGAVKTPFAMKMYGETQNIGSLTDQVTMAATHVQFANYNAA